MLIHFSKCILHLDVLLPCTIWLPPWWYAAGPPAVMPVKGLPCAPEVIFSPSIKYMAAAGLLFCSVHRSCISAMCAFSLCVAPFCGLAKQLTHCPSSYAHWLDNGKHCLFYQGWYIALLPWQKQWVKAQFVRLNSCSYLLRFSLIKVL